MKTKSARAWLVAAALICAAASQAPVRAAEPLDVNVVLSLTGQGAFLGQGEQQALNLAEKVANDSGGIGGRPLHFVFHDDETNPQVAVQLVSGIVAQNPAVVLGSSLVATCRAMAPLMKDGPVMYCFSPGIHPDPGSYVFSANVSTLDLAEATIRYFRLKGWTRIAFMFTTDATGQDAENGYKNILARPENSAMKTVEIGHFNTTDVSVSAQIEKIKAANPQAFISWSTGSPTATIFRGMVQAGLDVPLGTGDGNMTYAQMKQYADFLPKQLYIASSEWPVRDPALLSPAMAAKSKEFYDAYKAAGAQPDISAQLAWEPAMIIIHALKTLGPTATATQLRDYISHLKDFAGVDGTYNFEKVPQRGLDISDTIVTRWSAAAKTWQPVSKPTGIPLK
jgi:branched-chain amino acid transport system substrate-binding protein